MDVRISRIFADWYGFFVRNAQKAYKPKNPYQSVKIREIRISIVSQNDTISGIYFIKIYL
ncbi:MAG: hypothetical protein RL329_540 [Bacteroidota bacterium]|jgi:hypothetical protein